jgi:hypothetical protein
MVVPAPEADATVITMTTPAQGDQSLGDAWQWLIGMAGELCDVIHADLALINGFTVRPDGRGVGSTPAGDDVAPGHPPRVLLPWQYWSPSRVAENGMADALARLASAAFRSSPSPAGGWILQPHKDYSAEPPVKLLADYALVLNVTAQWIAVK